MACLSYSGNAYLYTTFIKTSKLKKGYTVEYSALLLWPYLILYFSVNIVFDKVLQEHQKARIENLLGITEDLQGAGYNVHQSKIAIGSGGFAGKGFLQGTQTKFDFVPEQSTDFIFCTVGEEWGFLGSLFIVLVYTYMLIRIISLAEKQKDTFSRIYGYCVASVIFLHFLST